MAWYYVLEGTSHGPVAEAEIQSLRQQNVVALDTPVWTDGMPEWLPFERSTLASGGVNDGPPVFTHTCAECGKAFPEGEMLQYENAWVCAACKPVFFQRVKEGVVAAGKLDYARIGPRFAAVFVDGLMIGILMLVLLWPMYAAMFTTFSHITPGHPPKLPQFSMGFRLYQYAVSYGIPAAYETFFIGAYGATLGKMLMKVKVITPDGGRVSYARALGRHFAKILSGIILYIGYLMAFWDEEKRALHDRICSTRVIVNNGP